MKNEKTNWSSPNTNIFAGINDLRKALASGENAVLLKEYNENCLYPIRIKKEQDFRQYKFSYGTMSTRKRIIEDNCLSEFDKHLSLNYTNCYGTPEAVDVYYTTGVLSKDNIKTMGRSHLVKVTDLIKLLNDMGETERANLFYDQYIWSAKGSEEKKHIFDFFKTDYNNIWGMKKFKQKLWVVEIHDKKVKLNLPTYQKVLIKIFNAVLHPLKYIPRKSSLRMEDYTIYTFRVGDVINGFSIQIQIPKKFSF
jgi:hypothetical protein